MSWTKTRNKYKDTDLMKEFKEWYYSQKGNSLVATPETSTKTFDNMKRIDWNSKNIKDIWGYLIIFADEIKGYSMISNLQTAYYNDANKTWLHLEPSMVWCIEEFFEMYK